MQLTKKPKVTYIYSVVVGGEKFQPCDLLNALWLVKHKGVELWNAQKKIDALNSVGALCGAVQKKVATPGPNIDQYITDLIAMVRGDADLSRLWDTRYAMDYHTGI